MTEEEIKVYGDKLKESALDALTMGCDELDPEEQIKYMKAAKAQLEVAESLKPKSWWDRPLISIKDIVIGVAAPVLGLVGVMYSANKRREEAELNLEAKRVEGNAQIECERIRAKSRIDQLKLITSSAELPDSYSLKVLNENNK